MKDKMKSMEQNKVLEIAKFPKKNSKYARCKWTF